MKKFLFLFCALIMSAIGMKAQDNMEAYEAAMAALEDGGTYRVFTERAGQKFYLNTSGYLVAESKKAATFTFNAVKADGTLYETGWNLGCKFTNPSLTNGSTGDIVNDGYIHVGSNDRNDWERQVFFLQDAKYAVRSTNANSPNWGANTYWNVSDNADLPEAGYSLEPAYVWQIEKFVDNRPAMFSTIQSWAGKLQDAVGLVTDVSQFSSNAKEPTEGSYEALIDGDYTTFFHSQWSGTGPNEDHYLQAVIEEPIADFYVYFKKRSQNNNNRPTEILISASNDGENFVDITTINEGLPTGATPIDYTSDKISLGDAYKYIRFTIKATNNGAMNNGHVFVTFSEFYLLPATELVETAAPYMRFGDYTDLEDSDAAAIDKVEAMFAAIEQDKAYDRALAAIEDGATYRVFTEKNGQKYYLNASGYLVAESKKAATFTFNAVKASGTLYETGWNLGCKFTNPSLTNGSTGDIVNDGHIHVGGNDRNDWERQVFFLQDAKYAVRSTNANSPNWGANTYWDVFDNAELPEAGYSLEPAYVWQIEEFVDNRPAALNTIQSWAGKLQEAIGLVTEASQFSSNAKESSEGSYEALLDGDYTTFFHSAWSTAEPNADHYLQAVIEEPVTDFYVYFKKRSQNNNNRPTDILISASNDGENFIDITTINEGLPTGATPIDYTSDKISLGDAYKYIRFTIKATNNGATHANSTHPFFTFSEFYLLPATQIVETAVPYMRIGDYTDLEETDIETINALDEKITNGDFADDQTALIKNPAYLGFGGENLYEGWNYTENAFKARTYEAPMNLITYSGNAAFEVNQVLKDVPAGLYKLTVNAFYRAGSLDDEKAKVAAGTELEKELTMYATTAADDTYSKKVMNLTEGATETNYNEGAQLDNGLYVPNSAADSRAWYIAGAYTNEVLFNVFEQGDVTIGLSKTAGLVSDYCPIGGWHLYRLGDADAEAATPDEKETINVEGVRYIRNVATNKYWGYGNSWGTQASLIDHADYVTLAKLEDGTYSMETRVSNGGTAYYFEGEYMDNGNPDHLTITKVGDNFTISGRNGVYGYNGTNTVLGNNLDAASENALWQILTKEEMDAELAAATEEAPVDATYLITDPNFSRNHRDVSAWSMEASNQNLSGGNNTNNCAESYHSVFTLSQEIEVPNGIYAMTAQGFYRQDGTDEENLPVFYANDETATFPLKTGSENSMSNASESFSKGLYTIEPIYFEVTEGKINLGAKLETNTALWCIWDNFVLTYYGADADINNVKFAALIAQVNALREKTQELKGTENVSEAANTGLEEVLSNTANVAKNEEALKAAIEALTAAIDKAEAGIEIAPKLEAAKRLVASTNVYTDEAKAAYEAIIAETEQKYLDGTLTNAEAGAFVNPEVVAGWHSSNAFDDMLLSAWTINDAQCNEFDTPLYINTWSIEGESDGSEFKVPFYEYWTGDANSLGEATLTATVPGVEPGGYAVSVWARVRAKNGYTAPAYGITLDVNDGSAVDVAAGEQIGTSQFYLAEFKAYGNVGEDGILKINLKVAADNNISWLSFKNVNYVKTSYVVSEAYDYGHWYRADVKGDSIAYNFAFNNTYKSADGIVKVQVANAENDSLLNHINKGVFVLNKGFRINTGGDRYVQKFTLTVPRDYEIINYTIDNSIEGAARGLYKYSLNKDMSNAVLLGADLYNLYKGTEEAKDSITEVVGGTRQFNFYLEPVITDEGGSVIDVVFTVNAQKIQHVEVASVKLASAKYDGTDITFDENRKATVDAEFDAEKVLEIIPEDENAEVIKVLPAEDGNEVIITVKGADSSYDPENVAVYTITFNPVAQPIQTAIEAVAAESADKAIYDLSGRRVSKAVKGIYIINGKKVVK